MQLMVTRAATLGTFLLLPAAYDTDHLSKIAKDAAAGGRSVRAPPPSAFEAGPGTILVAISLVSLALALTLLFMHGLLGFSTPAQVHLLPCFVKATGHGDAGDDGSGGGAKALGNGTPTDRDS